MRVFLIGFLVVAAIAVFKVGNVFGVFDYRYKWHQKTTVIVSTPEGEISASSVVRVSARIARSKNRLDQFGAAAHVVEGEAVALEVQPGRWLYLTIQEGVADRIRFALSDELGLIGSPEIIPKIPRMVGEPFALFPNTLSDSTLPDILSKLITFEDIADPKSAVEVDPEDLAATFGPGYVLVDVQLEIVRDDVTEGGLGPLGDWIMATQLTLDGRKSHTTESQYPVSNSLTRLNFKRVKVKE